MIFRARGVIYVTAICSATLLACERQGYGIEYGREIESVHSREQLAAGVDCLVQRIETLGLLTPGAAANHIRSSDIIVHVYPDPIVEGRGVEVTGRMHPDGTMYLRWRPGDDITKTSLNHELVHAILCKAQAIGPDCWGDAGHDASAWWRPVVDEANRCWSERLASIGGTE